MNFLVFVFPAPDMLLVKAWLDGCKISVNTDDEEVIISANREGLLSLSGQLRALAEGAPGDHIHYDAYNSLEEGSSEMIIQRVE